MKTALYNIVAILTMKQMRKRVPMLYYQTVWEQKGLYQEIWQAPLMGVIDPTNNTGMALTTMGILPGTVMVQTLAAGGHGLCFLLPGDF